MARLLEQSLQYYADLPYRYRAVDTCIVVSRVGVASL